MESMASREDGLASLCIGYLQILTHAGKTVSPFNWQNHSITYGMA